MADLEEKKRKTTQKLASVIVEEAQELQTVTPEADLTKLIPQTPSWKKSANILDEETKTDLLDTAVSLIKEKQAKFTSQPNLLNTFTSDEEGDEEDFEELNNFLANQDWDEEEEDSPILNKKADFYRETAPVGRPGNFSTGSTQSFNSGDKPKGTLDGGVPSAYNPMNRARNPDHEEAYGRKRTPGRMPSYEVTDNPGSAKVIPDNKGFANNSSALRQASSFMEQNRQLMEAAKAKSEKKERQMKVARLVQQIMKDFEEVLSLLDD